MSSNWVFYFVKPADFNQSGEIDEEDATVLYVSDKFGNSLKALTSVTENAVSLEMFDQQGFALIKMQRDSNHDSKFDEKDIEWYYIRLILTNLKLGKPIVFEN
jgi:5,10-methenyltetrahydromethanopterin hydrogenase